MSSLTKYLSHVKSQGVLAYPTETVWGLGCVVESEAVSKIHQLKQRDSDRPLSVLVPSIKSALELVSVEKDFLPLLEIFWPGPVTFVLPAKKKSIAQRLGSEKFIGLRLSSHEFVNSFMNQLGEPFVTTSVNLSGESPAREYKDLNWLPDDVLKVEDEYSIQLEAKPSTVVQIENKKIKLLRSGALDNKIQELFYKMKV